MSKNESIEERGNRTPLLFVGSLSVLIAAVASGILAATKLGYIQSLPGCGVGSGCDTVTNGPWGVVPIIGWPVSFLGFAWFVALFCGWIKSSGGSKSLLWLIRAGILGSLGFVVLMASIGHFCKWCMLAHVCNLVFWCITELIHRSRTSGVSASCFLTAVLPAFVATSIGLIVALQFVPALGERVDESTLPLLEARHRIGPENAPIQIVMFTDYQCPDCYRLEKRLGELVETSGDVSVSVKHFPLNYDCNDNIGMMKMHSNACWAARAAEAASIVGGEEGWEKMHEWLFTQKGSFTDDSIHRSLVELGFNPREFLGVMTSEETLQRVQQDADDGFGLGIYFTPMIFINGVEYLWYYGGQGTLLSAVDSIRSGLGGGSADVVPPPNATDKLLEDWRRGRRFSLPDHGNRAWLGGGDIEVVVWGDYQSSITSRLNTEIKSLLERDSRIKYSYRHFPLDKTCNAIASRSSTTYDGSCFLSKLVESTDVLTGDVARWKLHDWMFQQSTPIRLSKAIAKAAEFSGHDQSVIQDVMEGMEITNRIRGDIATKNSIWRKHIPVLMVDGRFVPRWSADGIETVDLFQRMLSVVESEVSSDKTGTR